MTARIRFLSCALGALCFAVPSTASAAPGDFDPSFSQDGLAIVDGPPATGTHVATQTSDKIVAASASTFMDALTLTRLDATGAINASFASFGRLQIFGCNGDSIRVLVEPDDEIVAASEDCLVKTSAEGVRDETFSNDGVVALHRATDVELNDEGRILVLSQGGFVQRFESDGSPDLGFGEEGEIAPEHATGGDLAVNGKHIYVTASAPRNGGPAVDPGVIRLEEDGTLDTTFGEGGAATIDSSQSLEGTATTVGIGPTGSVLVGGHEANPVGSFYATDAFVARFAADGSPDQTFGDEGVSRPAVPGVSTVADLVVRADGSVIAAGSQSEGRCFCPYPGLAGLLIGLTGAGAPDPTFGEEGLVIFGRSGRDAVQDIAIPDGGTHLFTGAFIEQSCCEGPTSAAVTRHLLTPGEVNLDADGLADSADPCPSRFAAGDGCPAYETEVKVFATGSSSATADVSGTAEECFSGLKAVVERKDPDGWRRVKAETDYPFIGGIRATIANPKPGRYRLSTKRKTVAGVGECKPAEPDAFRIR